MNVLYNFNLCPETELGLSPYNRAFQYGDGFFETIIIRNGKPSFLNLHWQRITEACKALRLNLPDLLNPEFLTNQLLQLLEANNLSKVPTVRVKFLLWRKPGGLYLPNNLETDCLIIAQPSITHNWQTRQKVVFAETVHTQYSAWSGFKSIGSLTYILAAMERANKQADEIIITDTNGNLSECNSANLFWIKDNILFTPALSTGCKNGIIRRAFQLYYGQKGMDFREVLANKTDLIQADAVFSGNVTGLQGFLIVDETRFKPEMFSVYGLDNLFMELPEH